MREQSKNISTLRVSGPEPTRSSYIDHGDGRRRGEGAITHSWTDFTAQRLKWIYQGADRSDAQAADLSAWRELGR